MEMKLFLMPHLRHSGIIEVIYLFLFYIGINANRHLNIVDLNKTNNRN